jgi:hypothetical protein
MNLSLNSFFSKIEISFKAATKGKETTKNLIWWWGIAGYLVAFFIADRIIKISNFKTLDIIISLLMVVYFCWHFYALKKCAPKKPKLSAQEKKLLRQKARKNLGKKLLRKFFLQEPISKWDPIFVVLVIDIFCIASFLKYTFK